jgi:L-asparaginase
MRKRILLLHTGGTLGMRPRHPDQVLAPDEFGFTVLKHVPEIEQIAEVEARVLFNLDSSDLTPDHWLTLAKTIFEARKDFQGVVITHGTDGMVYTASALSYLLRDLPFPVILTGSQRPLADVHTDGRANLLGAVDLATRPLCEVSIFFDGVLLRGNRSVKHSTFAFGAFHSPNHPALAEIGTDVKILSPTLAPNGPFRMEGKFDPRVLVAWLHPGADGALLRMLVKSDRVGVLIAAPGHGNLPVSDRKVAKGIADLVSAGKVVAIGSQSRNGKVDLNRYAGGRLAHDSGAVSIGDMTLEAATVKLMYLAGTLSTPDAIRDAVPRPIAGEVSE